ncbi:MAG: pyridoxal kinase, partial [Brooklawnia sp.]
LSGYQGAPQMGRTILDAAELVRRRNPQAIYCCDPVMGDVGRGFYTAPGIPEFMRDHVVPQATIITPNLFELEYLTGRTTDSFTEVLQAAAALRSRGPQTVLVTSVVGVGNGATAHNGQPAEHMRMIAQNQTETWLVNTPLIDRMFTGSGDLTTAIFLSNLLSSGGDLGHSLSMTASSVFSVLQTTHDLGRDELALVQAQDDIVAPRHRFEATRI